MSGRLSLCFVIAFYILLTYFSHCFCLFSFLFVQFFFYRILFAVTVYRSGAIIVAGSFAALKNSAIYVQQQQQQQQQQQRCTRSTTTRQ